MSLTTRKRNFYAFINRDTEGSVDGGETWKRGKEAKVFMGSQRTDSEGHEKSNDGRYHAGGPFYTARAKRNFSTKRIESRPAPNSPEIIRASLGWPILESQLPSGVQNCLNSASNARSTDTSDLDSYGSTAIAQVNPLSPNANMGIAFGEAMKDGLPTIPLAHTWKRRTEVARNAGSEFLNVVFGWLPLVNDVKSAAQSVRDGRDILRHYHDGEGSNTHREFAFPSEITESDLGTSLSYPSISPSASNSGLPQWFLGQLGPCYVNLSRRTETRRWFSGSFTYSVPSRGDSWDGVMNAGSEADKLFGITLTPEVLWELTPWSWAIDWFSNAGDVMSNITAFHQAGLVMRYGYMMEEKSDIITASLVKTEGSKPSLSRGIPTSSLEIVTKVRRPANPFGFGIGWEGLSPLQLAITAALGITRL